MHHLEPLVQLQIRKNLTNVVEYLEANVEREEPQPQAVLHDHLDVLRVSEAGQDVRVARRDALDVRLAPGRLQHPVVAAEQQEHVVAVMDVVVVVVRVSIRIGLDVVVEALAVDALHHRGGRLAVLAWGARETGTMNQRVRGESRKAVPEVKLNVTMNW